MTDIPEDIREKARECWRTIGFANDRFGSSEVVAAFLLAERKATIERCAGEIERRLPEGKMIRAHLAAAIRSLGG